MLDTHGRKYINGLFAGLAGGLLKLGLSPNQVTALAFVLGLGSGALLDAVDGEMARRSGKSSMLGAQLDIVSDRVVELGVVWALALRRPDCLLALLGLVSAILLSMTVFLTSGMLAKPRGKKSFYYQAGLMERTEGFVAFTAMMVFPTALEALTWIYCGLIGITILQRLWEARRMAKEINEQEEAK